MKNISIYIIGILTFISLITSVLLTAFNLAVFSDMKFYEKEYSGYNAADKVNMSFDDLMYVNHEMLEYLKGRRENLNIISTISGEEREFFNEKEKQHMADVLKLFDLARLSRNVSFVIFISGVFIIIYLGKKRLLPVFSLIALGILSLLEAFLAFVMANDFSKGFVVFHKLLFNNDLWLLDYETDLLIRILPETFFYDIALRIGIFFIISEILILIVSVAALRLLKLRFT